MWTHLIESRPSERSELAAWYRAVLSEQQRCGVSVDEAATAVGVTTTTLYAWRRRLGVAPCNAEVTAPGLVQVRVQRSADRTMHASGSSSRAGVVLQLGAGRTVQKTPTCDVDCLRRRIGVREAC
jgi:transposase-like protein